MTHICGQDWSMRANLLMQSRSLAFGISCLASYLMTVNVLFGAPPPKLARFANSCGLTCLFSLRLRFWVLLSPPPNALPFILDLKTQAIVKEIKHIRALPIPVNVKAFFLGVKVIPRFCYTASLNQIPKEVSKKFQSEIVQTLWGRRPHWRSRALVMTFLSEPHRNDPVCALAYHAVMDFLRFLRMPGNGRDKCLWAAAHCTVEHALLSKIKEAFRFFGLSLSPDLVLSFGGKPLMPAWDLHPKDIKMLLHRLSRHRCYLEAANQHRKDFRMPSGILDYDLTCGLRDKSTIKHESKAVVESHFVAQLVGCTLTRDRLCAASLDTSDKCRLWVCERIFSSSGF